MDTVFIDSLVEIPGAVAENGGFIPVAEVPYRDGNRLPEEILDAVRGATTAPVTLVPVSLAEVASPEVLIDIAGEEYFLPEPDPAAVSQIDDIGIEAIAYYLSFHVDRRPERWGIYLLVERLEDFAAETFGPLPITDLEKLMLAYRFVIDHELFHYWTDVACAQNEYIVRQPIYLPYLRGHPDLGSKLVQLEEALANARAWRRLPSYDARDLAGIALDAQPEGYRDWADYRSDGRFGEGRRRLGVEIDETVSGRPPLQLSPHEWSFHETRPGAGRRFVPLHRIGFGHRASRPYYQAQQRPINIEESEDFGRALGKLPPEVRTQWIKTRSDLEAGTWKGSKFGPLTGRPGVFVCRVGLRHRAFFQNPGGDEYVATNIRSREGAYK